MKEENISNRINQRTHMRCIKNKVVIKYPGHENRLPLDFIYIKEAPIRISFLPKIIYLSLLICLINLRKVPRFLLPPPPVLVDAQQVVINSNKFQI